MEKQKPTAGYKFKNKIMRFLPKAAISFSNPARVNPHHKYFGTRLSSKAFSGPIPTDVRRKNSEASEEPTSPKVSCIGRIKLKRMVCKKKHASLLKEFKPVSCFRPELSPAGPEPDELKQTIEGEDHFCSEGYWENDVVIPEWVADGGWRLEPRKEINLWKRRAMAQPKPLRLSI